MCICCVLSFLSWTIKVCALLFVWENVKAVMHVQCLPSYPGQKNKGQHNGNSGYLNTGITGFFPSFSMLIGYYFYNKMF